jgi:capsule polysaccharide export protein KpsC/LpsZ
LPSVFDGFQGKSVFAFHIHHWKRPILEAYFPEAHFRYLPLHLSGAEFRKVWVSQVKSSESSVFLAWGINLPQEAHHLAQEASIPVYHMEDGFLRSLNPHASRTPPFSLSIDTRAPYFDCTAASDLEVLLQTYPFERDAVLMRRATAGIAALLELRITKYNGPKDGGARSHARKGGKRVLVLGQVEDDASIKRGCLTSLTNNDVVRLAAEENKGAQIIYKPHPDVLSGVRSGLSDPSEVESMCEIMRDAVALPDALEGVDHVYTITSLAGFEALLRGIPVTVMGCPFYAGWGLTDDRQPNVRRQRKLSLHEVFAGVYLLYPRYFNPVSGRPSTFEECLEMIAAWQEVGMPPSAIVSAEAPDAVRFAVWGPYGALGWRHLLTFPLAKIIAQIGDPSDAETYKRDPIRFFRELSNPRYRRIGRMLYPWDP